MGFDGCHRAIRGAPVALIALLAGLALLTEVAEGAQWFARTRVAAEFTLGHDNNAYRQNMRTGGAAYLPFHFDLRHDLYRARGSWMRFYADVLGYRYAEHNDDANRETVRLKAEFSRNAFDAAAGLLRLHLAAAWRKHRQVYVSRIAGEEYTVDVGEEEVSLRDRFNSTTWKGIVGMEYRSPLGVAVTAETEFSERDYDEDYHAISQVESLDYEQQVWRFQLIRPARWGRLRAIYRTAHREYREYPALASDGSLVEGVLREYRYHTLGADVEIGLGVGWRLIAKGRFTTRQDRYVGYYDYDQWSIGPTIDGPGIARWRVTASYKWRVRSYPRAHVYNNPARPMRREETHLGEAEVRYDLSRPVCVFLGVGAIWHESRSESFSYDRVRTRLGVRFTGRLR